MDNDNMKSQVDQAKVLDKFLVDNAELEELSARLSVFNIFGTLRIEKTEIRHSNVLAWLLDPRGSHGTGQAFLRRVLSTILLDNESAEVDLTPAQIELMDMMDVEDGSDIAEEAGFICWSHTQMYHVVNHVFNQRKEGIPQDAKVFLEHYLVILRRITMQDDEIVKLCKAIYKNHKDAIDLIVEWGATSQFGSVAEIFLSEHKDLSQLKKRGVASSLLTVLKVS